MPRTPAAPDFEDLDPRDYPPDVAALIRAAQLTYDGYMEIDAAFGKQYRADWNGDRAGLAELAQLVGQQWAQLKAIRAEGARRIAQLDKEQADALDVPTVTWFACPSCSTGLAPVDDIDTHEGLQVECGCGRLYGFGYVAGGIMIANHIDELRPRWHVFNQSKTTSRRDGQRFGLWAPIDLPTVLYADLDGDKTKAANVEQLPYRSADPDAERNPEADAAEMRVSEGDRWEHAQAQHRLSDAEIDYLAERERDEQQRRYEAAQLDRRGDGVDTCDVCGDPFNVDQLVYGDEVNLGEYTKVCHTCYRRISTPKTPTATAPRYTLDELARAELIDTPSERQLTDWNIHNDHASDDSGD